MVLSRMGRVISDKMIKEKCIGFGFSPSESQHHFLAVRSEKQQRVLIYERFQWQADAKSQKIDVYVDAPKSEISLHKWELIQETVQTEFNRRLKKKNRSAGKFLLRQTVFSELFGKELMVLIWAIEDCDPSNIPRALQNWLGFQPEERWWLYTMTNAATGGIDDHRGWRKALRYALTENPINDRKQESLFRFAAVEEDDEEAVKE